MANSKTPPKQTEAKKTEPKKDAASAEAPAAPAKRGLMLPLVLLLAGLSLGGGGAASYFLFLHKPAAASDDAAEKEAKNAPTLERVKLERIMVPLIDAQGRLVRYASLDLQLEVTAADRSEADINNALARAGITRRMSQESVVSAADSGVVDYDRAAKVLTEAVNEGYGKPMVRRVLIISITTI